MPIEIGLEEVRKLLQEREVQLVEVLPVQEYVEEHVPGAMNIPLKSLDRTAVDGLDRSRPVVVYCWDDA